MAGQPTIRWCQDPLRAKELADFFASSVTPAYISHSELQGPRALSPDRWRDGLPEILRAEIEPRLAAHKESAPPATSKPILVADDGELVALSFVTFEGGAPVPYAIVEDLIVAPGHRGGGIGEAVMDWITEEARQRQIGRLFLESGEHNARAHHFFEQVGFSMCSIVMMRNL